MFLNTQMMGMDMGFPDVCLTPAPPAPVPVPIPYPNIAMGPMAIPNVPTVLTNFMPTHNMGTVVPMTNGDNPGLALGVASGTVMGPRRHLTAAFTVLIHGMPATRVTSVSLSNSTNCPGARLVPSQVGVVLLAP
jgi:hypothetical protein